MGEHLVAFHREACYLGDADLEAFRQEAFGLEDVGLEAFDLVAFGPEDADLGAFHQEDAMVILEVQDLFAEEVASIVEEGLSLRDLLDLGHPSYLFLQLFFA